MTVSLILLGGSLQQSTERKPWNAGHCYYFLEDVYPRQSGRRPLRTPQLLRMLFPGNEIRPLVPTDQLNQQQQQQPPGMQPPAAHPIPGDTPLLNPCVLLCYAVQPSCTRLGTIRWRCSCGHGLATACLHIVSKLVSRPLGAALAA